MATPLPSPIPPLRRKRNARVPSDVVLDLCVRGRSTDYDEEGWRRRKFCDF
ncbi:hypothetical protein Bca4012_083381 [Brassica carinata]